MEQEIGLEMLQQEEIGVEIAAAELVQIGPSCHVGLPAIDGGVRCLEEGNPFHGDMPHSHHREDSITIRHEGTHSMRQYWSMMKRESRRRQRESDASRSCSTEDVNQVCMKVSKCWQEATKGMSCNAKKDAFQCLLQQPTFRSFHHGYEKSILSNIRSTFTKVKTSVSKEELKLKRAVCMMLVNSEGDPSRSISNAKMARFTGLHRRNFAAANSRLQQAEAGTFPLQLCSRLQSQSRTITQDIKDLVFSFWQAETRVSPNKKDVCQKRLGRKAYIKHPVHLLDDSQVCS